MPGGLVNMKECIMVVDFGTSNARTNLIDLENGDIITGVSEPVLYDSPRADFHEIDVNDYWNASVKTTGKVIGQLKSDCRIRGIIFSYIGDSLVAVDEHGEPTSPMIASFDLRAKNDMELYTDVLGVERFEYISGCPLTPRNTGAKIHWIKKYLPDVAEKTKYYLTLQQYVNFKLGLGPISDYSVANRKLMLDVHTKKWSDDLMRLIDSGEEEMGPDICGGDKQIGTITAYGDVELPYEIPVFPGGHDSAVGFIGLGLKQDDHILGNVGGTFDHYGYLRTAYLDTLQIANVQTVAGPTSDTYVTIKAHPAGKDLLWFIHNMIHTNDMGKLNEYFDQAVFEGENKSFYTTGLDTGTGCFIHFSNLTDMQMLFNTLIEGMTFLSWEYVQLFMQLDRQFDTVRVGGGSGKSDRWLQLKADVFNMKVEKVKNLEVSSVGAAIAGAVGLGICSYEEAFHKMVQVEKTFYPRKEIHEKYKKRYEEWKSYAVK